MVILLCTQVFTYLVFFRINPEYFSELCSGRNILYVYMYYINYYIICVYDIYVYEKKNYHFDS